MGLRMHVLSIGLFLGLIGLCFTVSGCSSKSAAPKHQSYEFTSVSKSSIESTVSSTGTLAVVTEANVLAQMSGTIEKVLVDYNSHIKKGQLLATINTDLLKISERQSKATVAKYQAAYDLQALTVQNDKALHDKGLLSDFDYKSAMATESADKADLDSAQASLDQIQTEMNQYAFVTSPIDGIVLARDVDPGASVVGGTAATPTTLFTIATSLAQMEIEAEVDELDISSVKVGQPVKFTVEAAPGVTFPGTVKEIRMVPETSDNLVYYYVIILADNGEGKLFPGMTASVTFIKQSKDNVLTIPNAALRFSPVTLSAAEKQRALFIASLPPEMDTAKRTQVIADYDKQAQSQSSAKQSQGQTGLASLVMGGGGPGFGRPPMGGQGPQSAGQGKPGAHSAQSATTMKPLWYVDDQGKLAAVMVQVGISDATKTEVSGAPGLESKKIILKVKAE